MDNRDKINELFGILSEAEVYERAIGKLYFDMQCCAPEEGMEKAGEDIAVLERQYNRLVHSEKYEKLLCELHADSDGLDPLEIKAIEHLWDAHLKTKNLSEDLLYELSIAQGTAYSRWLTAKKEKDFSLFRDSLAKLVELTVKAVELRDDHPGTVYNNCLTDIEKGGGEEFLDGFFADVKTGILPLLAEIKNADKKIRTDFLNRPVPVTHQEKFSKYLLDLEGLRTGALVLMTTEHPFTTNFGPCDVRVTTHYYEENFISNIFSTLHEGGHALFMQNEPKEFYEKHLSDNMSNAMHECISRFFENIIGRSEAFIGFIYPKLGEICGDTFADVSERELYEAVNAVTPGLIRMEADELTYSLHIMVRYELEKMFVNGEIPAEDIPAIWNRKYKEYLGVDVTDDNRGCLQDVHWTESFGYFPSYALGNAYGAQILRTMEKDFDVFGEVRKGNLRVVSDWLRDKVFSIASVSTPDEWIRKITGESLNTNYFIDYLIEKYKDIYEL